MCPKVVNSSCTQGGRLKEAAQGGFWLGPRSFSAVVFTSIVPDGEVAAVGPLRSQAEEELVSSRRLVGINRSHYLDFLSDTPNT